MTFQTDSAYLIHLINSVLHSTVPEEKPAHISFDNVFQIGKAHEVANIAFLAIRQLKTKPEQALYEEWELAFLFSVKRDVLQKRQYEQVIGALHSRGIRTMEAQGTVTKTLYPSPELRMMSDIDLIVDKENLSAVREIMAELGYRIEESNENELDTFDENGYEIEFHTEFFNEYMYNRRERFFMAIHSPFAHAAPSKDGKTFYLTPTYYYLYSLLHIIKHFETAGCGVRRIVDIFYLNRALKEKIDRQLIDSVLKQYAFRESAEKLFALEKMWFEGEAPSSAATETAALILAGGNHGNREVHAHNVVKKYRREGKRFPKLSVLLEYLFPSREYIIIMYPECAERGYSTTRCRLYRLFNAINRSSFQNAVKRLKSIFKR